jgi:hypothetical protein
LYPEAKKAILRYLDYFLLTLIAAAIAYQLFLPTRRLAAISKAHQAAGFESPCAMRHAALSEVLRRSAAQAGGVSLTRQPVTVYRAGECLGNVTTGEKDRRRNRLAAARQAASRGGGVLIS